MQHRILPINHRESVLLAHMNLAPLPVIEWSPRFVENLIQAGEKAKKRRRAVGVVSLEKE